MILVKDFAKTLIGPINFSITVDEVRVIDNKFNFTPKYIKRDELIAKYGKYGLVGVVPIFTNRDEVGIRIGVRMED